MLAGFAAVLCLLLWRCGPAKKKEHGQQLPPARIALRQFMSGRYDSAIQNWNTAFASFKAGGQWDSIYGYEEKYIIAHSRLYEVAEGNAFLDTVSAHLLSQQPVDSIELSKLWVRRSEMLYTAANPRLARDTLLAVLHLRQRLLKYPHPLLADACDYLQIATAQAADLWTAADYGETGIRTYKDCLAAGWPRKDCNNLPWMIGNTGETYLDLGYYDKAIATLREAYDSLCANGAPIDSRLHYQVQLGGSYRRKGDFRAAISIFQKAIDSLKTTDNRYFEAEADMGLALSYKETGLREQMLLYARKQYAISSGLYKTGNHAEMAVSAALMADCSLSADDLPAAAQYIREALAIYQATRDTSSLDYLDARSLEGRLYQKRGFADSARTVLEAIVKQRSALVGDSNDLVALALLEVARNEDAAARYEASSQASGRALHIFSRTRNAGHPYIKACLYLLAHARWRGAGDKRGALRLIEQGTGATAPSSITSSTDRSHLQLLELAAQLLLPERESRDTMAWKISVTSYQQLMAAYNQFLNFSVFEGAHFAEGGSTIQAIKDGFLPAFRLYELTGNEAYMQAALDFSEQSRTGSIRLELQHYEANKFAHVPDSIIAREEALRIACATYEKLSLNAQSMAAPAARTAQWTDSLVAKRTAYTAFINEVAGRYPAYYQLKLANKTISLEALKKLAASGHTTVVAYVVSGGQLYAFICNADHCDLQYLPIAKERLEALTHSYREAMARADAAAYADAAWQLYAAVVAPLSPHLQQASVCVIPDEALSYISFESLLTAPVPGALAFRSLPYAIRQHDWHYAYSATVLAQQSALYSHRRDSLPRELVAMAPGFDRDVKAAAVPQDSLFLHLLRQPWALALAGQLAKGRDAAAFTGKAATEESFDEQAKDASVMYIGTHAFPDDNDPMQSELVFSKSIGVGAADGYLHAYEIYRSPVQMRLLVLGGCETGIGRLRSGEGIVSLASGFAYAGCPSIVMSLWSIDDQQTAAILTSFFRNAERQQPVSGALSGAKRQYLQRAGEDDALYNPLYWSGLVSIGLNEAVPLQPDSHRTPIGLWLAIAAVAGCVLIIFFKRRRRLLPLA